MNAQARIAAERGIVAQALKDSDHRAQVVAAGLSPELFHDEYARRVFTAQANGVDIGDVDALIAAGLIEQNYAELTRIDMLVVAQFAGNLTTVVKAQENERKYAAYVVALSEKRPRKAGLIERVELRRFRSANKPVEPIPRFLINQKSFSTPGNLTNIIAQAKGGKTAFIAAMLSAAICAEYGDEERDTLGVTATAPGKMRLIHFDTEQTPFDHDQLVRRSLHRSGVESEPDWLWSYCIAEDNIAERREALRAIMDKATKDGGVFAVIIDGVADLVLDVNDAAECNEFVAELHALAIKHACPIVNVIHENPGQDHGKMRGHLGSQLERKAESNLRLRKTDEVTVVFSEKMRRAPILEKDGPRFMWSDAAGMHVSAPSASTLREAESISDLRDLAEEVFAGATLRYADACKRIETARRVGEKAGEKWFSRMKKANVIRKQTLGFWEVTPL